MIAVGFLVSYDYEYLKYSLPCLYEQADKILLALDADRLSFTGKKFHFDENFKDWISRYDTQRKIEWLEKSFYDGDLSAVQMAVKTRNALLQHMQPADWYIQLDCDEYFLDFKGFVAFLRSMPKNETVQVVQCYWKTMFKQLNDGFLMIGGKAETVPVAINYPENNSERMFDSAEIRMVPFYMLHQSWARSPLEIEQKIKNWSHSQDFDTKRFFRFWRSVNSFNFGCLRHFHPLHPSVWPFLELVKASNTSDLLSFYRNHPPYESTTPALTFQQKIKRKFIRF